MGEFAMHVLLPGMGVGQEGDFPLKSSPQPINTAPCECDVNVYSFAVKCLLPAIRTISTPSGSISCGITEQSRNSFLVRCFFMF